MPSTRPLRAEVREATAVRVAPRVRRAMPRLLWGLLPLATIDVVLFVIPMVIMALFSLRFSEELLGLTGRWTVAHYVKVFTSEGIYLRILVKTIVIALVATAACLLVGYPFAYFIASTSRRWQGVLLTLVIMPFWTSYLLRVYAWTAILGDRGVINEALRFLRITDQPLSFLLFNVFYALEFGFGAAIAFVIATFVLVLLLGLRRSVDLERLYVG